MCNIRQARCPSRFQIVLGVLFLFAAIIYAVIQIVQIEQSKDFDVSSSQALRQYWFYLYPVLIGLWTEITAAVGVCASKQDPRTSICKICTFLQFSLILAGVQAYLLFDFIFHFLETYHKIHNGLCEALNKKITTNCYFRISLEGNILGLGGLIVLQGLWSILCCCSAICCNNQTVEPRREEVEIHVPAEMRGVGKSPPGNHGYQLGNPENPPPYPEVPGSSEAIIINRQATQAYYIRPVPAEMRGVGKSTSQPQSTQLNTRPVLPPISSHVAPSAPTMDAENNPIDDGNYPYNPNWPPPPGNHGY